MSIPIRYSHSLEAEVLFAIKAGDCPSCQRRGFLVGHGNLKGYAPNDLQVEVRGKRFLCSNRGAKHRGCGKTFSILRSDKIKRHLVPTFLLWHFLVLFLGGLTLKGAWMEALLQTDYRFCDSLVYKLWPKFRRRQSVLRTRLFSIASKPADTEQLSSNLRDPCLAQILEHWRRAFPKESDPFAAFQVQFQSGIFSN